MKDIRFRRARAGDEEQILKLVEEVLSPYGLKLNPKGEDLDITNITKFYTENNGAFEVLEFKRKIIGSYGIYKIDEETCELRKMYLHKDFQGMGLGNIMIERGYIIKRLLYKQIQCYIRHLNFIKNMGLKILKMKFVRDVI